MIEKIIAILASLFVNYLLAKKTGSLEQEKKNAEEDTKAAKEEALRHANTPLTPSDASRMLRERAAKKRNNSSKDNTGK